MSAERPIKDPKPTRIIDCPDCGRTTTFNLKCASCGGDYWLPAGYFDRKFLRRVVTEIEGRST
jgi:hypothetical protein